jgi:hypothetical protein
VVVDMLVQAEVVVVELFIVMHILSQQEQNILL